MNSLKNKPLEKSRGFCVLEANQCDLELTTTVVAMRSAGFQGAFLSVAQTVAKAMLCGLNFLL